MDDERNWSESIVLEPQDCVSRSLPGYLAQVPVRYSSLRDNVTLSGNAMAGMVVGRVPDLDVDWRPWENQLVMDPSQGLQLKSTYTETGLLGTTTPQP